ncbi:unnamed protein product [Spirodela intermedia]|uniref:Uncharacterized protein n=1 Tax=Spirodela intermedia TaxID=51605 RepID=A0A7I8KD83_SPIIN|nr:unnamed protein product [Spirodela intermedia]
MRRETEEKKGEKVKRGWLVVTVGLDDGTGGGAAAATLPRFAIPISYMRHPLFMGLLEAAQDVYGYPSAGPLKLPCSVDDFIHLRRLIERGPPISGNHRCPRRRSFSLNTC